MKVPTDSNVKAVDLIGRDVPEVPVGDRKTAKSDAEVKPKRELQLRSPQTPSPTKEKSKDLKKTTERKFADSSKLTATFFYRKGLRRDKT
jgi:hypothetical protein